MDDYAKARYKDTQELTILKFIDDNGKMNPDISEVDFIQDGDLNKSLQHFVSRPMCFWLDKPYQCLFFQCLEILEDHEEAFLQHYMADENPGRPEFRICHDKAQYCNAVGNGAFGQTDENIKHEL